jgi:hypothetical protein
MKLIMNSFLLLGAVAAQVTLEQLAAQVEALEDQVAETKESNEITLPLVIAALCIILIFGIVGAILLLQRGRGKLEAVDSEMGMSPVNKVPSASPSEVKEQPIAVQQVSRVPSPAPIDKEVPTAGPSDAKSPPIAQNESSPPASTAPVVMEGEVKESSPKVIEEPPVAQQESIVPSSTSMNGQPVNDPRATAEDTPTMRILTKVKDGVLQIGSGSKPASGATSPSSAPGTKINFFDGKSTPKVKMEAQLFSGSFGEVWRGTCKVWTARANKKEQRSRSKETLQGQWEIPCSSHEVVFCRDYQDIDYETRTVFVLNI